MRSASRKASARRGSTSERANDVVRFARQLLAEAREERTVADQKASLLFAAIGTGIGIFVAVAVSRNWSPMELPLGAVVFWWVGAVALGGSVVMLGAAVYPRLGAAPRRNATTVFSFREVAACENAEILRCALEAASRDELDGVTQQLLILGRVTESKYRCIRVALWLVGVGTSLNVIVMLVVRTRS